MRPGLRWAQSFPHPPTVGQEMKTWHGAFPERSQGSTPHPCLSGPCSLECRPPVVTVPSTGHQQGQKPQAPGSSFPPWPTPSMCPFHMGLPCLGSPGFSCPGLGCGAAGGGCCRGWECPLGWGAGELLLDSTTGGLREEGQVALWKEGGGACCLTLPLAPSCPAASSPAR